MARRYFGTDGVRGVVGEFLTPTSSSGSAGRRRSGAAPSASSSGATRAGRGRSSRRRSRAGCVSAGGIAVLGGVLPTPAVALAALDLGVVISASHNPPEYNGVKFFDARGRKLPDAAEEEIEALLDAPAAAERGEVERSRRRRRGLPRVRARALRLRPRAACGSRVDCANGAYSGLAPRAFERLGAEVTRSANEPDGTNINVGCGATDTAALQALVAGGGFDLGIAFDGDGDRHARGRRARRARRRRPDRRDPRARPRRRPRRGHADDEPRLPRADARARDPRASRPTSATATCSRRSAARAACSAASSRAT